ncbi:MAG: IS66 family insertion sequence element accessory protein TnpB [Deltaproteobacteria bacterium]|nr:IS66 family insertion sequence element accessory protein TnpB [Deltaproteobacteria bacterium]
MLSWPDPRLPVDGSDGHAQGLPGLAAIVREEWSGNPQSGDLYVFANRRRDLLKCLYWERTGYVIVYKQLAKGTFRIPRAAPGSRLEMTTVELALLLDGADPRQLPRRTVSPPEKLRYDAKTFRFTVDNVCTS